MTIDNLTFKEIKEINALFNSDTLNGLQPFEIGKAYLIRTVTHINIGVVKAVGKTEIVLSDCSWIADTGRYHNAIKDGKLNEVEPYTHDVIMGRGAIIDATEWVHDLPREQI